MDKATIVFVMSVRPSAWKNSVPTERIFSKFGIWVFFENLVKIQCMYVYTCLCMYVCMYIYMYVCVCMYLLTYSMVQSPSWAADWLAASQEIPRISRNPKVHYRTHKRPPPVPILGQPNPVHIPTSHLLEIHPNIHPPTPTSPQWSLSLRFPHQDHLHSPLLNHKRHMPSSSLNLDKVLKHEN